MKTIDQRHIAYPIFESIEILSDFFTFPSLATCSHRWLHTPLTVVLDRFVKREYHSLGYSHKLVPP